MASDKMLGSFDQKSAPEDNDLLVEYDASASKVKNVKFGGVWNWIVKKLTSAVINELQTSSKNVVGAINELNSKRLCLQQIYGGGKYKDCNDLPIGESAIVFSSALNKPDSNIYFIFCIGSIEDKIKIQYAIKYVLAWNVRTRIYDFNDGTWSNWN